MYYVRIALCCVGLDMFCITWNSEREAQMQVRNRGYFWLMNETNGVKAVSVD